MPAVMATDGVWVPEGGIYELVVALARLAEASGVEIRTEEPAERVEEGRVFARGSVYEPDVIVADLDADRLENLLTPGRTSGPKRLTPSGVAMYAVFKETLPAEVPSRNTLLPADTDAFFASLESGDEPDQTMVFLNHYRPGEVYPNEKGTLTLQLAVPASGRRYDLADPLVAREMRRTEGPYVCPAPWRAICKATSS
jgi:phytoene dehydrogenase-like protein